MLTLHLSYVIMLNDFNFHLDNKSYIFFIYQNSLSQHGSFVIHFNETQMKTYSINLIMSRHDESSRIIFKYIQFDIT